MIFLKLVNALGLHDSPLVDGAKEVITKKEKFNERVYEKYLHFIKVLESEELV